MTTPDSNTPADRPAAIAEMAAAAAPPAAASTPSPEPESEDTRPTITRRQLTWEMALAGLKAAEEAEAMGGDPEALAALTEPLAPVPVGRFEMARPSTRGLYVLNALNKLAKDSESYNAGTDYAVMGWAYCEPNSLFALLRAGKSWDEIVLASVAGEFGDMSINEFCAIRYVHNQLIARAGRIGGAVDEVLAQAAESGDEAARGKPKSKSASKPAAAAGS